MQLFRPGDAPSEDYCSLRDREHCVEWKAHCEALWKRYAPYADRHFLSEFRIQFDPRFWEMYLAVAFLDHRFKLLKHKNGGPEFGIDIEGKRYWFEAITATAGTGPDAVPPLVPGAYAASLVPEEQIILRITSALETKRAKWAKDLSEGRVSERDGYIVCINARSIRGVPLGSDMPYVVKGLYGFGHPSVTVDTKTFEVIESKYLHRPTIAKASGTGISSQPFTARECPEVSAVLYSHVDAANYPERTGADFIIVHNDQPAVPVPRGALRFAHEYWVEEGYLHMKDWSKSESASAEG